MIVLKLIEPPLIFMTITIDMAEYYFSYDFVVHWECLQANEKDFVIKTLNCSKSYCEPNCKLVCIIVFKVNRSLPLQNMRVLFYPLQKIPLRFLLAKYIVLVSSLGCTF
jgi:hypothetical protein